MTTIAIELNDADAQLICQHAELEGKSVPDFIHDVVLEWIEDQEDAAALREAMAEDDGTRYTFVEIRKRLGA